MAIRNVLLTSTNVLPVFAAAASEEQAVTTMFFCNNSINTATDALINIYLVPQGSGGPGTGTIVINSLSLPHQETFVFDAEKLILYNTDAIWAQSNVANVVVATVSSVKTS